MRYIYVVLIKAHTGLGQFARLLTGYEYTHIAVCKSKHLDDFVTFSRKYHYLPLDAGFMHEYRDYYAFGHHGSVKVKVFRLPIKSAESYNRINRFISDCEHDSELMFNLFSMMTMRLIHGFEIYKAYNCMSFVSTIIQLSDTVKMDKPYYRYSISDIDALLQEFVCFEGFLAKKSSPDYGEYMKKFCISKVVSSGCCTVFKLLRRLIHPTI